MRRPIGCTHRPLILPAFRTIPFRCRSRCSRPPANDLTHGDKQSDARSEGRFQTKLTETRVDALLVGPGPFLDSRRDLLVALAAKVMISAAFETRATAVAGGLMSYGASVADGYRQAGYLHGRILKGAKPAELPVVQPTEFELVINLKTAKTLGLDVPPTAARPRRRGDRIEAGVLQLLTAAFDAVDGSSTGT